MTGGGGDSCSKKKTSKEGSSECKGAALFETLKGELGELF